VVTVTIYTMPIAMPLISYTPQLHRYDLPLCLSLVIQTVNSIIFGRVSMTVPQLLAQH